MLTKGKLGDVVFQFNPTTVSEDGGRTRIALTSANMKPKNVTTGYKEKTITFELLFADGYSTYDCQRALAKLIEMRDSDKPFNLILGRYYSGKVFVDASTAIESFHPDLRPKMFRIPIMCKEA